MMHILLNIKTWYLNILLICFIYNASVEVLINSYMTLMTIIMEYIKFWRKKGITIN